MTDNVRYLNPDSPEAVRANRTPASNIANALESLADRIRSGEDSVDYMIVCWKDKEGAPHKLAIGDQTLHEHILLATICQHYAIRELDE